MYTNVTQEALAEAASEDWYIKGVKTVTCMYVAPIRMVHSGTPLPSMGHSPGIVHTIISIHSQTWDSTHYY